MALHLSEEQGFRREADRQTFWGRAGWDDYGVVDGRAQMEFTDRMGRLREELAIGLGRLTLLDKEREEPGAVARTMTGRRRNDDNNDTK
jgi:hypothetical protein